MAQIEKLSPIESIKVKSRGLRGTLATEVKEKLTGAIRDDDQAVIKFHGMYQQDDRDRREERAEKKLERLYSFMIRLRLPGGFLTATQWLAAQDIAQDNGTGTIKITTRQTIQLHGLLKSHIKPTIQAFHLHQLDSIATCGDINRNVLCSSHPKESPIHEQVFAYADKISRLLMPKTNAYYEIWIDDEKVLDKKDETDPLYEDRYLPRKFKIAIAIPPNNDVDVFANDIGLIAVIENEKLLGFNIAIGGGLSTTHGNPNTYARVATVIGFVEQEKDVLSTVYEILTVQRDFGNRSDRKLARLKYTVDKMGVANFQKELEKRIGFPLQAPRTYTFTQRTDWFGWQQNHQGFWYYTIMIENGVVKDSPDFKIKTALVALAKTNAFTIRFTANQNIIRADITEKDKPKIQAILDEYKISAYQEKTSLLRKNAMACVALPTCPLALAEAQRYLPTLVGKVELLMTKHRLDQEQIIIRMTGCPNGCARPYLASIGFIGTAMGKYNLHLGGDIAGVRLNKIYKQSLDEQQILHELDTLFGVFVKQRNAQESFGDFAFRKKWVS